MLIHGRALAWEAVRSGVIASVAIVPIGLAFRHFGFRIGHYGPKFAALFIETPQPWHLFVQHLIVGCLSAVPLLALLLWLRSSAAWWLAGGLYGAAYYVVVNSLALPLYFRDPTPWQIGWDTVLPSLLGHIAFGICIGWTSRAYIERSRNRTRGLDGVSAHAREDANAL